MHRVSDFERSPQTLSTTPHGLLTKKANPLFGDTAETLATLLLRPHRTFHKTLSEWMVWLEDLKLI